MIARSTCSHFASIAAAAAVALMAAGCGDGDSGSGGTAPTSFGFSTTPRLRARAGARSRRGGVSARRRRCACSAPISAGRTSATASSTILFGDTWQRIDICPLQLNDDSLATLAMPADDWPGFEATQSIPDEECPELTFDVDEAGTAFAPIELHRWDGVVVPLGPLNTPVTGFYDGQREWAIFIVGGGQRCTPEEATAGAPCPTTLSPQAADLTCGLHQRPAAVPRSDQHANAATAARPTTCTSPSASDRRRTSPAPCSSPTSTST